MKKAGILAAISIVFSASFCSAGAPRHKPVVVAPPPPEPVVVVPPPEPVVVVPPPEPVVVAPAPHPGPHHDKHHGHAGGIVRDIGKATAGIIHELKD